MLHVYHPRWIAPGWMASSVAGMLNQRPRPGCGVTPVDRYAYDDGDNMTLRVTGRADTERQRTHPCGKENGIW